MRPLLKFGDKLTRENNEILALDREVDTAGAGALLSTQRYGTEHFFFLLRRFGQHCCHQRERVKSKIGLELVAMLDSNSSACKVLT